MSKAFSLSVFSSIVSSNAMNLNSSSTSRLSTSTPSRLCSNGSCAVSVVTCHQIRSSTCGILSLLMIHWRSSQYLQLPFCRSEGKTSCRLTLYKTLRLSLRTYRQSM
uniref:Uncharacterized protein n=1 Tax=Cacopsylla melanoneura TaxID=428564 RepID=A0A8D8Z7E5_9HEMI